MREVNGVKVRALTRKEVRELKKYGFYLSFYNPPLSDPDFVDEGVEKVLEICAMDADAMLALYEAPHQLTMEVFFGILKETYGARDEEKNLPSSGNGSQTDAV